MGFGVDIMMSFLMVMVRLADGNRNRKCWHFVAMFPLFVVTMMRMSGLMIIFMMRAFVIWISWLHIFMVEMEFGFFSLCHLICVMMLSNHRMLKFFPVWCISKVRSRDPVVIMVINFGSMRSRVP